MHALITGVTGFVGRHLCDHLIREGATVAGIARGAGETATPRGVRVYHGDVRDAGFLLEVVAEVQPTHVFHLAAVMGAGDSSTPYEINVVGTAHLFSAVRAASRSARVVISSSSAVYGAPQSMPISENEPLRPATDYAASKVGQEMIAVAYQFRGVDVVRIRPFNLIGPRQPPALVTSAIARQIVEAERGGDAVVRIGNTETERDYTDVRDAVRAFALLAVDETLQDVYNVCSGVPHSVQECLDLLLGMTSSALTVERDPALVREGDILRQVGSAKRLSQATAWRPVIAFKESLAALLDDCRRNSTMERRIHA